MMYLKYIDTENIKYFDLTVGKIYKGKTASDELSHYWITGDSGIKNLYHKSFFKDVTRELKLKQLI